MNCGYLNFGKFTGLKLFMQGSFFFATKKEQLTQGFRKLNIIGSSARSEMYVCQLFLPNGNA